MNRTLHIRKYEPSDKPRLLEILKTNIPDYFAESELSDLEEYLDHKVELYFVAELNGAITGAGGINIDTDRRTGKISWDYIDRKNHGAGIGRALLQHRLRLLLAMNTIEHITVRTSQVAYRFYEKNGFVLREVVKDYWAEGFDLYSMEYEKPAGN